MRRYQIWSKMVILGEKVRWSGARLDHSHRSGGGQIRKRIMIGFVDFAPKSRLAKQPF